MAGWEVSATLRGEMSGGEVPRWEVSGFHIIYISNLHVMKSKN